MEESTFIYDCKIWKALEKDILSNRHFLISYHRKKHGNHHESHKGSIEHGLDWKNLSSLWK